MCNNNGHCRKFDAGTMCPSYRVTRDEKHLTRGRANTLRLALSGQFGADFASEAVHEALDLCVSCKGCRRDCPTGVDMAKMKIEFLYHWQTRARLSLKERAIACLPRWAPWAAACRGSPICATRCRVRRGSPKDGWLVRAPHAAALARRHVSARAQHRGAATERAGATWCCSSTRSREYFEPENAQRGDRCAAAPPAIASQIAAPDADDAEPGGRCAAAARFSPRAWSTKRSARRAAWSLRCCRTSSAAPPSSVWSRRAC